MVGEYVKLKTMAFEINCKPLTEIEKVYLLNLNDCVIDGDTIVRMKRKYGKFKRKVVVLDRSNHQ
jgi:hypothetical protein